MSPILLRPIREQFEHDRVIRQLQARWRRRFEAAINVGSDEEVAVKSGSRTLYPDLVLTSTTSGRRLHGVVEVETAESVNHLEAMAEWKHFAKIRGAFYLYVPAGFTDVAERLCADGRINVTEVWAYYAIASQVKFSMTYRSPRAKLAAKAAAKAPRPTTRVAKSKSKPKPKPKPKPKKPAAKRPNAKKTVVKKKAARKKTVAKKAAKKKASARRKK